MYKLLRFLFLLSLLFIIPRLGAISIIINNSIPKSGSYLLAKTILLLTGRKAARHFSVIEPIIDSLNNILDDEYIEINHILYNEENNQAFIEYNCKMIFIYRDPRDQVVSHAYWVLKYPEIYLWAIGMEFNDVLLSLIKDGLPYQSLSNYPWKEITNLDAFYRSFLSWLNKELDYVYSVRYEDLVGKKGGGNDLAQFNSVKSIAKHLGLGLSDEDLLKVSGILFAKSTFREGQIGSWKKHFNENHILAFKEVAGDLLIELEYEEDFNW